MNIKISAKAMPAVATMRRLFWRTNNSQERGVFLGMGSVATLVSALAKELIQSQSNDR
jgi:hypothetical protein